MNTQAARATAQTDAFELVLVLTPPTLTIYLDDFNTNQPVPGATLELEGSGYQAVATAVAPGIYSAPAGVLATPGRYPLTISVQAADQADLLDATLVHDASTSTSTSVSQLGPTAGPGTGLSANSVLPAALLLLAALGAALILRQVRRRSSPALPQEIDPS